MKSTCQLSLNATADGSTFTTCKLHEWRVQTVAHCRVNGGKAGQTRLNFGGTVFAKAISDKTAKSN
jgi:hypothetical protein